MYPSIPAHLHSLRHRVQKIHKFIYRLLLLFSLAVPMLTGCSKDDAPKKLQELDYTVVSGTDIPDELDALIKERQKKDFQLTFSDNSCLYIIKGYGKQKSGGFSIVINDFYLSDDCMVFDTELFGPKSDETVSDKPTYPYIVIKTTYREQPVTFR